MSRRKRKSKRGRAQSSAKLRNNGLWAFKSSDYSQAIAAWERVGRQSPDMQPTQALAEAYFRRGLERLYAQPPEPEAGLDDLRQAAALQPDSTCYLYHVGLAAQHQEDLEAAIAAYQKVSQTETEFAKRVAYPFALAVLQQGKDPSKHPLWSKLSPEERARLENADAFRRRPYNVTSDAPLLWQGVAALDQGEQDAAKAALTQALGNAAAPEQASLAHYYLGVLAAQNENWPEARKQWGEAAAAGLSTPYLSDNLGELYHRLAEERLTDEDVEGALAAANEAMRHRPDDNGLRSLLSQVYQRLGHQAALKGKWTEAHDHWQKAYDFEDGSFRLAYNLALAYEQAEEFILAGETWREVLRRRPRRDDHPDAVNDEEIARIWERAAQAYTKAGEYDEAIHVYKQAVKRDPDSLETRISLVDILMVNGRLQAAQNELERILDNEPDYIPALLKMGEVFSQYGYSWYTHNATQYWERVLEIEPNNQEARRSLADFYMNQGDHALYWGNFNSAISYYNQALEHQPHDALIMAVLGGAYFQRKEQDTAETYMDAALEHSAGNLSVYDELIRIWLSIGYVERAWQAVAHAESAIPALPFQFYLNHAVYCLEIDRRDLLPPWIERAIEKAPPREPIMLTIGEAFLLAGALDLAESYLEQALAAEQSPGQTHLLLGILRSRDNDMYEAKKHWSEARKIARRTQDEELLGRVEMVQSIFDVPPGLLDIFTQGGLGPGGLESFLNFLDDEEFEDDEDFFDFFGA